MSSPYSKLLCPSTRHNLLAAGLVLAVIVAVTRVAPTDYYMGDAQRILYVHVPVAWSSLMGCVLMAVTGILYLRHGDLNWDHWARASGEVGWLASTLTLTTGSLWAHSAWGTWWTWDPRLTASFVLWMIYSGTLILRGSFRNAHQSARLSSILAIVGLLDVPLVIMATRWFRGIHPIAPRMEPSMRLVLMTSVVGFTVFFLVLLVRRRTQLRLEHMLTDMSQELPAGPGRQVVA